MTREQFEMLVESFRSAVESSVDANWDHIAESSSETYAELTAALDVESAARAALIEAFEGMGKR